MKTQIPKYVKTSVERWEKILKDARESKVVLWGVQPSIKVYGNCGYCEEFICGDCPLFSDICEADYDSKLLYWEICDRLEKSKGKTDKTTIKMIEKMLSAVKTRWKGKKEGDNGIHKRADKTSKKD